MLLVTALVDGPEHNITTCQVFSSLHRFGRTVLNHNSSLFKVSFMNRLTRTLEQPTCQYAANIILSIFVRKCEELAKVAEETKKNFAAYERDDLKLREVSSFLNPLCLPSNFCKSTRTMRQRPAGVDGCTVSGVTGIGVILNL